MASAADEHKPETSATARPEVGRALGRFVLGARLGAGTGGAVYRATEHATGRAVAIKLFDELSGEERADLKRTFVGVADIVHPHLVFPEELVVDGEDAYLVMEYVAGVDLTAWLREAGAARMSRLRQALDHLSQGLWELHRHDLVHGDVKPDNLRVRPSGDVVLLDTGTVARVGERPGFRGTPLYAAPEMARGADVRPSADWYSVGVLLYEALTGRPPFVGEARDVLVAKATGPAPRPDGAPADLAALCASLLEVEPAARGGYRALRDALGLTVREGLPTGGELLGRDGDIATILSAASECSPDGSVSVHVRGESGIGKTAVLTTATGILSERFAVRPLRGRCHERALVPYNAVDGVVEDLAQLVRRRPGVAATLAPEQRDALARGFPALADAFGRAAPGSHPGPSLAPLARDALSQGLLALMRALDPDGLWVLAMDDLQWGDADSAHVVLDLLSARRTERVALLLAYRPDEAASSPFLRAFLALEGEVPGHSRVTVDLAALDPSYAFALARRMTGDDGQAARVVEDAGGSPFLIELLAGGGEGGRGDALSARASELLDGLTDDARATLETVAIAGHPLAPGVVEAAAGLTAPAPQAWASLRAARLVRTAGLGVELRAELYHDRLRRPVLARVDDLARRGVHRRLARALIAAGGGELEAVADHIEASDGPAAASGWAAAAARRAEAALAFGRAAELYGRAIAGTPPDDPGYDELLERRAAALVRAGHTSDGALIYLDLANRSEGTAQLEMHRLAVEYLLIAGEIARGREELGRLLERIDIALPRTDWRSKVTLILGLLRLISVRYRRRAWGRRPASAMADKLVYLESLTKGVASYDVPVGGRLMVRTALAAIEAGDPGVASFGLANAGSVCGFPGRPRDTERGHQLVDAAERYARDAGSPGRLGNCVMARAIVFCTAGDWRQALGHFDESAVMLQASPGNLWELDSAKLNPLFVLFNLGDYGELRHRVFELQHDALARGDWTLGVAVMIFRGMIALIDDDPVAAREIADEAVARWASERYTFQRWHALRVLVLSDLYEGGPAALARLDAAVPRMRREGLMDIQILRVDVRWMQGAAALAALSDPATGSRRARRVVKRAIRNLRGEKRAYALAAAEALRAGLMAHLGRPDDATEALALARAHYEQADMGGHALACEARLAAVGHGVPGPALDTIGAAGVRRPERWIDALLPGWSTGP